MEVRVGITCKEGPGIFYFFCAQNILHKKMVFEMVKAASMAEMMEIFDHAKKVWRHVFDALACSFSFS